MVEYAALRHAELAVSEVPMPLRDITRRDAGDDTITDSSVPRPSPC